MEKKEWNLSNIAQHPFNTNKEFLTAFTEFLLLRKKLKKPTTPTGESLLVLKVVKLSNDDVAKAIAIIHQSLEHSWQGFFPLITN